MSLDAVKGPAYIDDVQALLEEMAANGRVYVKATRITREVEADLSMRQVGYALGQLRVAGVIEKHSPGHRGKTVWRITAGSGSDGDG